MSNVLNLVAPSFIGISYLSQALEMKNLLETYGAKFDLPENFEENEDTFLELLPQLIEAYPLYFTKCAADTEVESAFFSLISMIQLLSQVCSVVITSVLVLIITRVNCNYTGAVNCNWQWRLERYLCVDSVLSSNYIVDCVVYCVV